MSIGAGIAIVGIWLGIGLMAFSPEYGGVAVLGCFVGVIATVCVAATVE